MDKWDELRFVLAVGRTGGLSSAARLLGVNHSTVSRNITAFEQRLQTRLFDRLQTGFVPTDAGRQAIDTAERIEQAFIDLGRQIDSNDQGLEGTLRVTAPQLIIQVHLAEIVAKFASENPKIDISLLAANEIVNLNKREADVAVRVSNNPAENLHGRRIAKQNRAYFAAKSYIQSVDQKYEARWHDAPIACVSFSWWGKEVPTDVRQRFPKAHVAIECDDMIAVHNAIRSGMGIGRLPCFLGDPDDKLARVPALEPEPYLDIWILTHPDLKTTARVRRFMRFAAKEFQKRASLYLGT